GHARRHVDRSGTGGGHAHARTPREAAVGVRHHGGALLVTAVDRPHTELDAGALGLEHRAAHEIEERVHTLGLERLGEQLRTGNRSHDTLRDASRWMRRYPNSAPVSPFAGVAPSGTARGVRETLGPCESSPQAGSWESSRRSRRSRPRSPPPRSRSRWTGSSAWSGRRKGRSSMATSTT